MATIQVKDGDDFTMRLSRLSLRVKEDVIGAALYAGGNVAANLVRQELESVPTDEGWGTTEKPIKGPKAVQKTALLQSLGIASMREDGSGFYDIKIGFDGYNSTKTKRWPRGQPNQMIARSVESGTTFMTKNPFLKRAAAKARKQAVAAMKEAGEKAMEQIMEE